jgi:hypothetical protein
MHLAGLWQCYQDYCASAASTLLRDVDKAAIAAVMFLAIVCLLGWVKNSICMQHGPLCYCVVFEFGILTRPRTVQYDLLAR